MPAFDASIDYLQLLDLEPAAVVGLGVEGLRQRIQKKKKEWTAQEVNPLYHQKARLHKERICQFEGILTDAAVLTAYVKHLAEVRVERRQQQEEHLRALVAVAAAGKKELSPRQRELLKKEARTRDIPESMVETVLKDLGIKVQSAAGAAADKPKLPYLAPALDRTIVSDLNKRLEILGKQSLYELLDLPNTSRPLRLTAAAQLLYAKWSRMLPKTTTCEAWEKTLQACLTYLKDDDAKARYDRALFNQRLDQFVQRIDLVLAGNVVERAEQVFLVRLGVEEYGFSDKVAEQCILARAAEKGISIAAAAQVTIRLEGHVQCRRCFGWNARTLVQCRGCGGSLTRKCENPACRGKAVPAEAKLCPHCQLPVLKGKQYNTLLELADVFLERGNIKAALQVCRLAQQILRGPAVEARLERAGKIRALLASVRGHLAAKALSQALPELQQLAALAPYLAQPGLASLETIANYMAAARAKMSQVSADADPVEAARIYLGYLGQWTDCDEAFQKARALCGILEGRRQVRAALQLARKLLELRPTDEELVKRVVQLDQRLKLAETPRKPPAAPQRT